MERHLFRIQTRDGRAQLTGQVDLPSPGRGPARYPFVLMVPGGWFMDRDGFMGGLGTERDLIYRDLGKDLLSAGFAVVRYDNRGVRCNEMTMPPCPKGSGEPEFSRHYLSACVDPDVRQTVRTVRRITSAFTLVAESGYSSAQEAAARRGLASLPRNREWLCVLFQSASLMC